MAIDNRIVRLGVTINGKLHVYDDLAINAQGSKFASATQNETTIKIANLDKVTRDFLSTEGTPFNRLRNRPRQSVYIEAGRVSTGVTRIFVGDITLVTLSQPPDIWTTIKAITSQFFKGKIVATNETAISTIKKISQKAADSMGLSLLFSATDKQVANYGYTGAAEKQIEKIAELGAVDAYIDDDTLVVKDKNAPISTGVRLVSAGTGMIGMPEFNDFGVKVRVLFDALLKVGDQIEVKSETYPAANGRYITYKIDFDISSREQPFYYMIEARRQGGVFNG